MIRPITSGTRSSHCMSQIELAESFKLLGNAFFKEDNYTDAIVEYTKSIIYNPTKVAFFTNRALCYLKLDNYTSTIQDCEHAIQLDATNVKAHSMALTHDESRLGEAVRSLTKAYNLAVTQKTTTITEINQLYRNAKRQLWSVNEERRRSDEALHYRHLKGCVLLSANASNSDEIQGYLDRLLENDVHARKRQIPEHFLGKISLEIMTDPVITPCGITYDRVEILQHLSRIGHFDPLSRVYLTEAQLIPNLALKECIDEYLKENGWALDY